TCEALGCIYTIPGAIGAFRTKALVELGGMSTDTLAEDSDITVALVRAGWRIVFEEKAAAPAPSPPTKRPISRSMPPSEGNGRSRLPSLRIHPRSGWGCQRYAR